MTTPRSVMKLAVTDIDEMDADQYVGLIDEAAVTCLSVRFAVEGLLTPIWVRRNGNAARTKWSVVAGRHRLRAALALGWTDIDAEQRAEANSSADDLRRLQVAENLDRRVLRPIEYACFVMDRWRAAAEHAVQSAPANQQGRAIRARWNVLEAISNTPAGDRGAVDQVTGEACGGKSDRSVRTYRKLYEAIVVGLPDHFALLNAHPLGENLSAMSRIATLKHVEARRKAADAVLSRDDWQSMDEALSASGIAASTGNRVDPDQPDLIFMTAFGKMKGVRRRVSLCALATELTPTEVLDMVDVFKKRRIISENIKVA